jgi:hypothetical protein
MVAFTSCKNVDGNQRADTLTTDRPTVHVNCTGGLHLHGTSHCDFNITDTMWDVHWVQCMLSAEVTARLLS